MNELYTLPGSRFPGFLASWGSVIFGSLVATLIMIGATR